MDDELYVVRKRGRWLDSWSATGPFRARWSSALGCACQFTRLAMAKNAAAKTSGEVIRLVPSRMVPGAASPRQSEEST